MAYKRRATLASPVVIRYWMLGLLAWAALVFVIAGTGRTAANDPGDTPAATLAPAPDVLIPMHVFTETRFRLLRANMTGDYLRVGTCTHVRPRHGTADCGRRLRPVCWGSRPRCE